MSYAAKILSHRSLRRRHILALIVLFLTVATAFLWGATAVRAHKIIDDLAKAPKPFFQFSSQYTNGTPWAVHVHLENFSTQNLGSHELKAKEAVLYLYLWDWKNASIKLKHDVQGKINNTTFTADTIKFGIEQPEEKPVNETETGLTIWGGAYDIELAAKNKGALFNDHIEKLTFQARILGTPPDFLQRDSIAAWNDASGVFEVDEFELNWMPLSLSAKGTIGLNSELQPEGAFSARIEGLDAVIGFLVDQGTIEKRQETILRSSLQVLSRPSGMINASAPIVPITLQDAGLFLGPVRLTDLPVFSWP